MNKYQEALNKVYELISDLDFGSQLKCAEQLKILQELVDKETPKKYKIKTDTDGRIIWACPKCGKILKKFWSDVETIRPFNYCDECGQKLDWSDEDGK